MMKERDSALVQADALKNGAAVTVEKCLQLEKQVENSSMSQSTMSAVREELDRALTEVDVFKKRAAAAEEKCARLESEVEGLHNEQKETIAVARWREFVILSQLLPHKSHQNGGEWQADVATLTDQLKDIMRDRDAQKINASQLASRLHEITEAHDSVLRAMDQVSTLLAAKE